MLRSRRVWFGFAITLIFLFLFFVDPIKFELRIDFGEIRDAFAEANYVIAFASLPVYFVGVWFRTWRWQYLLRPVAKVSVWRLYPVVIIGLMANNLIPARAGELVRAYILGERERVSKAASLGTIAVDRLFDGLALIPMLVIVALLVGSGNEKFEADLYFASFNVDFVGLAVLMAVLFGIAMVILTILAVSEPWQRRFDALVMRFTPARLRPSVEGLTHGFFSGLHSLRNPFDMGMALSLSIISWLLEATMYYIVGLGFDIDVGFQHFLLATAAANLAIAVLASQGGVGPFEFVTKQTFIAAGVGSSVAAAYAIGLHALVLLPVIVVGLYFLGTMQLSLGEMFRRSTAGAATGAPGSTGDG